MDRSMPNIQTELLTFSDRPRLSNGTLLVAFSGWMDGGDVSTGTIQRLVDLIEAKPFAEIDPDPFYIYNFPGSMEMSALFRPEIRVVDGLVTSIELPSTKFFVSEQHNLMMFIGKEPNLRWQTFAECLFHLAHESGVTRILFVGSFGGAVPHTRDPKLYTTCSKPELLGEMEQFGMRRTGYEGPGSFMSYLMSRSEDAGLEMVSLIAEIPHYLTVTNPSSIEAVSRRLAKILQLPLDLDELRTASTEWELEVSTAIDENDDLAERVREYEQAYDNELVGNEPADEVMGPDDLGDFDGLILDDFGSDDE
jgi:proteasome assembly chaperone (PAC2) family protein